MCADMRKHYVSSDRPGRLSHLLAGRLALGRLNAKRDHNKGSVSFRGHSQSKGRGLKGKAAHRHACEAMKAKDGILRGILRGMWGNLRLRWNEGERRAGGQTNSARTTRAAASRSSHTHICA